MSTPILFIVDAPEKQTGLSRIARDLLTRLNATSDEFRVGCLGVGGTGSSRFGFQQYFADIFEVTNWRTHKALGDVLPHVWRDFAGAQDGVIFTICEPSWLLWFARPEYTRKSGYAGLADFLESKHIEKWTYAIIDAEGPNGALNCVYKEILAGYNRVIAPSRWASRLTSVPSHRSPADYLPHGIDGNTFLPLYDKEACRKELGFSQQDFVVGTVMTNQSRKDWGLTGAIAAELRKVAPNLKLWWHTDAEERAWSIPAIAQDFGLGDILHLTLGGTDQEMCRRYNACNVTILPSNGEGFGYPIAESEFCGVPCVHVDYAAGAEIASSTVRVGSWRYEGLYNSVRPVTYPSAWVEGILGLEMQKDLAQLEWETLWPKWKQWFERGVATSPSSLSEISAT